MNNYRPISLILACTLGLLGAAFTIPALFTSAAQNHGLGYIAYLGLYVCLLTASFLLIWQLKKWGVSLFLIMSLLNQVVHYQLKIWTPLNLLLPLLITLILLFNLKHLRN